MHVCTLMAQLPHGETSPWQCLCMVNWALCPTYNILPFKQQLLQRFVPYALRLQALQDFRSLRQTSSVQEYSAQFRSRHSALRLMPEVHVPDETNCAGQFLHGLKSQVRKSFEARADAEDLQSLDTVIALAEDADKVLLSLQAYAASYASDSRGLAPEVKDAQPKARVVQGEKRRDPPANEARALKSPSHTGPQASWPGQWKSLFDTGCPMGNFSFIPTPLMHRASVLLGRLQGSAYAVATSMTGGCPIHMAPRTAQPTTSSTALSR